MLTISLLRVEVVLEEVHQAVVLEDSKKCLV